MKAYPNLSTAIGGEEGGVCMGPAIVVMANGDGQCGCCCWDCCWCPVVSPLILSGGVNVPGIIPLPTSIKYIQNISTLKLHVYHFNTILLFGINHFVRILILTSIGISVFCIWALPICKRKEVKLGFRFYFYSHIIHFSWIKHSMWCSFVLWENANCTWSALLSCNHIHLLEIF